MKVTVDAPLVHVDEKGGEVEPSAAAKRIAGMLLSIINYSEECADETVEFSITHSPGEKWKMVAYTGDSFPLSCEWTGDTLDELVKNVDENPEGMDAEDTE